MLQRILNDSRFGLTAEELYRLLDVHSFTGRAKEQAEEFLNEYVKPVLKANEELLGIDVVIKV